LLDNAEHLTDAVARLVPVLTSAAPALRVLVTSQLPLAIAGEQVERIDPLALPAPDASDTQALATGALAMFVDRVLAADRRYRFTPESLPIARALCAALDGLPLALEMAAARVPLLGLQRVHDALAERFSMLRHAQRDVPGRHRTLLAALDWSHGLLTPEEQRMLRALGVFAGGFTLDLAVAVAGGDAADRWDTIDSLGVLVERSLVFGDHADPPRYALLETIRSYALARLAASGDEQAVRGRHAAALLAFLRHCTAAPLDPAGAALRQSAAAEMHNVREAIVWAQQHDAATAVHLAIDAAAVSTFTRWRRDASDWLAACEPLLGRLPPALQASWWRHFATQMLFRGSPRAVEAGRRAVSGCRAVGDTEGLVWSLVALARSTLVLMPGEDVSEVTDELMALVESHPEWPARAQAAALGTMALVSESRGDYALSLQQRLQELEIARAGNLGGTVDACESNIAEMLALLGRYDEALQRLRTHLARVQGKDSFNIGHLHLGILGTLLHAGRPDDALAEAEAALRACRRHGMPEIAEVTALIAAQRGQPRTAALLLGHARRAYAAAGGQLVEVAETAFGRAHALVARHLAADEIERLLARGATLDERAADRLLYAPHDDTEAV
jgi:non-specific serine/threonine protein kinase